MTPATSRAKTLAVILFVVALAALLGLASPAAAAKSSRSAWDKIEPSTPTDVVVSAATATSVTLTWSRSTDNVGVAYYLIVIGLEPVTGTRSTTGTITRLRCGSSYAAGVQAVDWAGNRSARGLLTVTTSPCADGQAPTAPASVRQLVTTGTSVVLGWSASTDNIGVVGYGLYRAGLRIGTSAEPSATLSGLTCGTTASYGVDAVDAAGNRSQQTTVFVRTSDCGDTGPPTAPSGLSVTSRTATGLGVSWTAANDDTAITGYRISVDGAQVGTSTTTSFTIGSLACGTSYEVSVDAFDAAGNRSEAAATTGSTTACATTTPADSVAPTAPGSVRVQSATPSSLALAWNASTDNVGVAGYGLHRNGQQVGTTSSPPSSVAGLSCGAAVTVGVDAFDAAGNRSPRTEIVATTMPCADTQAPTVPSGVVTTSRTATSIALSWSASTDNVGVTSYGAYRGGSRVASTTERTFVFSGLACGTSYTLGLDATDAAGNRSSQAVVMVATTACAESAPAAPSQTAQTQLSDVAWTSGTNGWGPVERDRSNGEQGSSDGRPLVLDGTTFGKGLGVHAPSELRYPLPEGCTRFRASVGVDDEVGSRGSVTFEVYANTTRIFDSGVMTGSSATKTVDAPITGARELRLVVTTAGDNPDFDHADWAEARIECTTSAASLPAGSTGDTQSPATPTGVAVSGASSNSVTVRWDATTDNVGVSGYRVLLDGAASGQTSATSYTIGGLSCAKSYAVAVEAFDAAGNTSARAQISATTPPCQTATPPSAGYPTTGALTISSGGTYTGGNWSSVVIATTAPVAITNSVVSGNGDLIRTSIAGANVTLTRVTGSGGTGRFFRGENVKSVRIENCSLNRTTGIYFQGAQPAASIVVTRNRQRDVQGASYYTQFLQFDKVTTASIDVSWNEVINSFGQSRVEDNISLYKTAQAKIHDNYIEGAYPSSAGGGFSGSGIMVDEVGSHSNEIYGNIIVDTTNAGIGVSGGSNNRVHDNRLVFDGRLDDGTVLAAANVGIYVWNLYGDPAWGNNQAYNNTVGWINKSGIRNDTWMPDCSGNCSNSALSGTLDRAAEAAEYERWRAKLSAAGVAVGA